MKKSILIVISIFLSTGVFAYEKELFGGELPYGVKTLEEVIHCFEGKWMDENLYNSLKRASETSHWTDIYSSEKRKCPNGKQYMIETVEEKKKGVLYLGYRNGKFGYFSEKWEGVESKENKDISKAIKIFQRHLSAGLHGALLRFN